MPTPLRRLHAVLSIAILLLSVYFGFGNTHDIFNTITIPQRLVGVGATGYGIMAIVVLYGMWRTPPWLVTAIYIWGILVVGTVLLATVTYSDALATNLVVLAISGLLVAILVLYGRGVDAKRS